MTHTRYDTALSELNPSQRRAVETIDGPVMVIAGPGTGKTHVITLRIAHILRETDTPARSIVALTFTESAAHTMRERLLGLIGPVAYQVKVLTFHAFCEEIIRAHVEYFPIHQKAQSLNEVDKYQLLEKLLTTLPLKVLRTVGSAFHYLPSILSTLSTIKREGVTPQHYMELVEAERALFDQEAGELKKSARDKREKEIEKMDELGKVYAAYQQELSVRQRYDFDDMIRFVVEAFALHPSLLLEVQEQFLYLMVDEYQDTNTAQNAIVTALCSFWGDRANVCVVGDPHQSIFRFQGASLENTLSFLHQYPNAEMIFLEVGYRCPQTFYSAAAQVISQVAPLHTVQLRDRIGENLLSNIEALLNTPLRAKSTNNVRIAIDEYATPQAEQLGIVERIRAQIQAGSSPSEIAVLYRKNSEGNRLYELLRSHEVPVSVARTENALDAPLVQQLIRLFNVVVGVRGGAANEDATTLLFAPWWGIEPLELMRLVRRAATEKNTLLSLSTEEPIIREYFSRLQRWSVEELQQSLVPWCEKVLTEAGVTRWLLAQPDRIALAHQLQTFMVFLYQESEKNPQCHVHDVLLTLQAMRDHAITLPMEQLAVGDAVTLSTVHKAKGQEWGHVFLYNITDGTWGNQKALRTLPLPSGMLEFERLGPEDALNDDRRLMYVALTRAKTSLTLSYAKTVQRGQQLKQRLPSQFIEEIDSNLILRQKKEETHSAEAVVHALHSPSRATWKQEERSWLAEQLAHFHLSYSALNAYLQDPQQFFISQILRLPQLPTAPQLFGVSMHAALEFFVRTALRVGTLPDKKMVKEVFHTSLSAQPFDERERARWQVHGDAVLDSYLPQLAQTMSQSKSAEYHIGGESQRVTWNGWSLKGTIDRIDLLEEKNNTTRVRVIDYKTGRPQSHAEVLGEVGVEEYSERELRLPLPLRGRLKRQALFYTLLLDLDPRHTYHAERARFDFIVPNSRGAFVSREIELLEEDVELIKQLIDEVMQEIHQLDVFSLP